MFAWDQLLSSTGEALQRSQVETTKKFCLLSGVHEH
jgi:hypothetical protein